MPVADIGRAKGFYTEQLGFHHNHYVRPSAAVRVVQLTSPGSACSIVLGEGMAGIVIPPGSLRGLHLVVANIAAARAELAGRGVLMGEIQDLGCESAHLNVQPSGLAASTLRNNWQRNRKRAAAAQHAFHPQPATLHGDKLAGNAQAQARARAAAVAGFVG